MRGHTTVPFRLQATTPVDGRRMILFTDVCETDFSSATTLTPRSYTIRDSCCEKIHVQQSQKLH